MLPSSQALRLHAASIGVTGSKPSHGRGNGTATRTVRSDGPDPRRCLCSFTFFPSMLVSAELLLPVDSAASSAVTRPSSLCCPLSISFSPRLKAQLDPDGCFDAQRPPSSRRPLHTRRASRANPASIIRPTVPEMARWSGPSFSQLPRFCLSLPTANIRKFATSTLFWTVPDRGC